MIKHEQMKTKSNKALLEIDDFQLKMCLYVKLVFG